MLFVQIPVFVTRTIRNTQTQAWAKYSVFVAIRTDVFIIGEFQVWYRDGVRHVISRDIFSAPADWVEFRRPCVILTATKCSKFRIFGNNHYKSLKSIHEEMKENETGRCGTYGAENKSTKIFFGGNPQGKWPFGRPRRRWEDNFKVNP